MHQSKSVPFAPHDGFHIAFKGNLLVKGTKIVIPKDLPFNNFKELYDTYSQEDRDQIMHDAKTQAKQILSEHKEKTGIAILGQPPPHILVDKKLTGDIRKQSIVTGEELALNALAAELYTLKIAKIKPGQYRKYVGRSQLPKFTRNAVAAAGIPEFIAREHLIVSIVRNNIHEIIHTEAAAMKTYRNVGKFGRFIDDNVIIENLDCTFANKTVRAYLEIEDWAFLSGALKQYKQKLKLLQEEIYEIIDKLIKKLTLAAAFASTNQ